MAYTKPALLALAAMLLAFPAIADGCFGKKIKGGKNNEDQPATSVRISFTNEADNGIATYITDPGESEERLWVPEGETETRKFDLYGEFEKFEFELDYSPLSSRTQLLYFSVRNDANFPSPGVHYHKTVYDSSGTQPNNVKCNRTWRSKNQRWEIDITYK